MASNPGSSHGRQHTLATGLWLHILTGDLQVLPLRAPSPPSSRIFRDPSRSTFTCRSRRRVKSGAAGSTVTCKTFRICAR